MRACPTNYRKGFVGVVFSLVVLLVGIEGSWYKAHIAVVLQGIVCQKSVSARYFIRPLAQKT